MYECVSRVCFLSSEEGGDLLDWSGCEQPSVAAEKWAWDLCRSSEFSYLLHHLSSFIHLGLLGANVIFQSMEDLDFRWLDKGCSACGNFFMCSWRRKDSTYKAQNILEGKHVIKSFSMIGTKIM